MNVLAIKGTFSDFAEAISGNERFLAQSLVDGVKI